MTTPRMTDTACKWTPGPWPWEYTGDGKRITIGYGLVEGPNGYEVAEVYSDDCPPEVAEANARLIAAAPDLLEAMVGTAASLVAAISLLERGGKSAKKAAPSDKMFDQMIADYKASVGHARAAIMKARGNAPPRAALAKARGEA